MASFKVSSQKGTSRPTWLHPKLPFDLKNEVEVHRNCKSADLLRTSKKTQHTCRSKIRSTKMQPEL